jgi:fumarylacetoacetase
MYCSCQFPYSTLQKSTLNDFAALGRETVNAVRMFVKYLLVTNTPILQNNKQLRSQVVVDTLGEKAGVQMHLPFETRDFTDFLNSRVVCELPSLDDR